MLLVIDATRSIVILHKKIRPRKTLQLQTSKWIKSYVNFKELTVIYILNTCSWWCCIVVLATLYLYQETCKLSYEIKCDPQFFEKETPSKMIMFLIVLYAMGPIFSLIWSDFVGSIIANTHLHRAYFIFGNGVYGIKYHSKYPQTSL